MFCNIGYRYYKCVNFLANESKIYVLIYRIQVMSMSQLQTNRRFI